MKSLIFLLFIAFVTTQTIRKGLIDRQFCIGGRLNKTCQCPNNTALIGYECKPCIGGTIVSGKCTCPKGKALVGNYCTLFKPCPNNTFFIGYTCKPCIGGSIVPGKCTCPKGKALVGNYCKLLRPCPRGYTRINLNDCLPRSSRPILKPVIYLYPEETMDISV